MTEQQQPDLIARPEQADVEELRRVLRELGCWVKREQLVRLTGWSERTLRDLLHALGADVVRSTEEGFKLTDDLTDDELGIAKRAADFAVAQARVQGTYGVRLRRRLHGRIG